MEPPATGHADGVHAIRESDEHDGRRKREPEPGGDTSEQPCAPDPNGHAHLAARGAWKELAECHEIRIAILIDPFPSDDVLLPKIAQVSNGASKRGEAQAEGRPRHFQY
jgi:hypothetical protein